MVNESDLLYAILQNVVGFDLNPLAVLTARVNYLLAVVDLLEYRQGDITIPIYLADSVRTPATGKDLWSARAYEFLTAIGKFMVPVTLCIKGRFDKFCEKLEDSIKAGLATDIFVRRMEKELGLQEEEWVQDDIEKLSELYTSFDDLHRNGMDGMWARLLKNNYAPITSRKFHFIIGNPPWVNWESLPDGYRDDTKPIWQKYGLFPHGGMDTILGKGKKDIAMIMTYVVMDKLLLAGGRLGFVITQSVLKTSGAGQGFRRFAIPQGAGNEEIPLRALHIDDMVALNPFEGASNRTAIMILEKGRATNYPVPYTLWQKLKRGRFTYDDSLQEVTAATKRLEYFGEPVSEGDITSSWLTARRPLLKAIRKALGKSDYKAYEGVNSGGANGVYWIDIVMERPDGVLIIQNITERGKVEGVEQISGAIEPALVFPLLRGRDVKRWKAHPSGHILMVQDTQKRRGIDEKEMQQLYPLTYGYLKRFEKILRNRAAFKRYFTHRDKKGKTIERGPFYSMFNAGEYTFAPYKLVWRYIASEMTSAVLINKNDDKLVIPDHRLIIVPLDNADEAYYLAGCLNNSISRFIVSCFIIGTQISTHVLEKLKIPNYNPTHDNHKIISSLSAKAHIAAKNENIIILEKLEDEIDLHAAQLWGLSEVELKEIKKGLAEVAKSESGDVNKQDY